MNAPNSLRSSGDEGAHVGEAVADFGLGDGFGRGANRGKSRRKRYDFTTFAGQAGTSRVASA
jgi:hypothetical protein